MSENYILSLNHNDLNTLSRKLKDSSEYFKDLSHEIKGLYNKLNWQTASKENVYKNVRKASDSAFNIYRFLNNASKTINRISRDFHDADRDAANFVSKEASHIRRQIRSSGVKLASSNAFTDFLNKLSKLFFGDNKYGTLPISPIPRNIKYSLAKNTDTDADKMDFGLSWAKLGVNPWTFCDAKGNTVNFYLSSSILATITIMKRRSFSKTFKFTKTGASIVRFKHSGEVYYLITGKKSALKDLDITLPPKGKKYKLAQGQGVPDELMEKIDFKKLDEKLNKAGSDYRKKLTDFKKSNPQLQPGNLDLSKKMLELRLDTLSKLEKSLGPLEAALVRARMEILKNAASGDLERDAADLNKNFKVQAVLKDIEPSLLRDLPKVESLDRLSRLKSDYRFACKQLATDFKLFNPIDAYKGFVAEGKAIIKAGGFLKGFAKFCKSSVILCAIGIGIDLFFDLFVDNEGKKWDDYYADIVVDIGFGIAVAAASTFLSSIIIGAAIGTCVPIPFVGTVVGALIGAVIGVLIILATEVITINGKSLKDWAKEAAKAYVNIQVGGLKKSYNAISSGWNSLFGGGDKSGKSHTASPTTQAYDNQTTNLQTTSSPTTSGTTLNYGSNFQNRFATS